MPGPRGISAPGPRVAAALVTLALAAPALAACSSDDKVSAPSCPRTVVLADAASLTRFADGPGRDPLDVRYEVRVADLLSGCRFETAEEVAQEVLVAVAPILAVDRGPAGEGRQASFAYFVSVIAPDERILNKEAFEVEVAFEGNQRRVIRSEDDPPVTVSIPIDRPAQAQQYQVLVGLQLSKDDLRYNRSRLDAAR
jgi:hypothetical protein